MDFRRNPTEELTKEDLTSRHRALYHLPVLKSNWEAFFGPSLEEEEHKKATSTEGRQKADDFLSKSLSDSENSTFSLVKDIPKMDEDF